MSEIKCPVCQNNLHKINIIVSTCTNDKCKLWGASIPNLVLEALIDTKKKLDKALDGLEYADKCLTGGTVGWKTEIRKIIEQINQKEQQ